MRSIIRNINEGAVDASFCAMSYPLRYSLSDSLLYKERKYIYSKVIQPNNPLTHFNVYMYGAGTLQKNGVPANGWVMRSKCSFVGVGNIVYTNVVETNYASEYGDAGGLVCGMILQNETRIRIYGIHLASRQGLSYFVPAYAINQAFGLTVY